MIITFALVLSIGQTFLAIDNFKSLESCKAAANKIVALAPLHYGRGDSDGNNKVTRTKVTYVCVAK